MRVLLVRPNSNAVSCPPPLGLGYLSHAVKSRRGDKTLIIDGRRYRLTNEAIVRKARQFDPDLIGITAMSIEARYMKALVVSFRKEIPQTPIIIGGPHSTAWGPSLLDTLEADFSVIGEGEDTLVELLDALESKQDISAVKGLVWRDGEKACYNGPRPFIQDMDRLGVDWDGIGPEEYFGGWSRNGFYTFARSGKRLPVFTSRGCPMGCAYCHSIFGRQYRTFTPEKVVGDMVSLRDRYGLEEFEIHDDFFNCRFDHAKEVLSLMIDRNLKCAVAFPNGFRADRMDEELLDLMVRAGTYQVTYAIESASERIQKLVHKNLDLQRAREVVNMTVRRRIITGTYNMFGFPEETEEEMHRTVDYAVSLPNHVARFFYLTPFPGTELAEWSPEVAEQVRNVDFASYLTASFNLSAVPDDVFASIVKTAYRRFYLSPSRMFRIARDMPKNTRLLRGLAIARLGFSQSVSD